MKMLISIAIFAAALLVSGGCDPLNPYALSGPQGEDAQSQDATGSADIATTDNGEETSGTSVDETTTPTDPCEACASDEVCWDDNWCVDPAWVTLVTEKIPGTWTDVDHQESDTVHLKEDYSIGDFPGVVKRFSSFNVKSDGTVDYISESSGSHIFGSFFEENEKLHFSYTYSRPNKPLYEATLVRTSP